MAISLSKNQTVSLSKEQPGLSHLHIGLGWDPAKKGGFFSKLMSGSDEIDLDASLLMLDSKKDVIDVVWFQQLKSRDGSIIHTGDNLTGEGDGDDEVIRVDLGRIAPEAEFLVVTINSFRGQTFDEVDNAFCRIVNETNGTEICRYELREKGKNTGVVMAVISRTSGDWQVKALGIPTGGRTVLDMVQPALAHI